MKNIVCHFSSISMPDFPKKVNFAKMVHMTIFTNPVIYVMNGWDQIYIVHIFT